MKKICFFPYFLLAGLSNDTTHNSLRLLYRSAKIDWTKKPIWVYSPPPSRGVGTMKVDIQTLWNINIINSKFFQHRPQNSYFYLYLAQGFYNSKHKLYPGADFLLKIWPQMFMFFGVMILVKPKQEVKQKATSFAALKNYHSNLQKEWENCHWTKICVLTSGVLFTFNILTSNFTVFIFQFFWIF